MPRKKENKPPAFQMYAADFYMDTQELTTCEVGAYIRLLMVQWTNTSLPREIDRLATIAGMQMEDFKIVWPKLRKKFVDYGDGGSRFVNPRLVETRENLKKFKRVKSDAGKKGAEVRWAEDMKAKEKLKVIEAIEKEKAGSPELVITGKYVIDKAVKTYTEVDYIWKEQVFKDAWSAWCKYKKLEHRQKYKTPLSESRAIKHLHKITNGNLEMALEAIEESMGQNYQGIHPSSDLKKKYGIKADGNKKIDTANYGGSEKI
jgi:uncharacterized protein YdaU (DUF1376 family)